MYEDNGNEYNLGIVGVGGKNGGFYLAKIHGTDKTKLKEPDFPIGGVYNKLKIRSDVAFQVMKIEWLSEIQK